jgi:methylthioribose-1-phosphate isomerase
MFKTLEWTEAGVVMIDQRKLPSEELYPVFKNYQEVAAAIKEMGVALGAKQIGATDLAAFEREFLHICDTLASTRPTAVNLFWAIERMKQKFYQLFSTKDLPLIREALEAEAILMHAEDIELNRRMGAHGAQLIQPKARILTHCNAGALATAGYGTALGVIRAAMEQGKDVEVYADETRPFLQGARLTAWELQKDNIPVTLITDNMAGHFMRAGEIDCVIVGADRVAANGDVANKIGTYSVAVLARENGIPFYVAAPISTLDLTLATGEQIPIEQRSSTEVTQIAGHAIAPAGIRVANPAFDVTPNRYISAIITERGVARPPYQESLSQLAAQPLKKD